MFFFMKNSTWKAKEGPRKDSYNVGDNPQYKLQINQSGSCAIWIHLIRHITDKDDFAENKEFITVVVFKGNGKRIFYPCMYCMRKLTYFYMYFLYKYIR